jgi:hypothetical protein
MGRKEEALLLMYWYYIYDGPVTLRVYKDTPLLASETAVVAVTLYYCFPYC